METPGDRFMKSLKKWVSDFSKTKYAIPTIVALSCLVYYAVITSITNVCFSNLIAPLVMLFMLWKSGVKRIRKLLIIGAIATLFFAGILSVVVVTQLQHVDPVIATNEDGRIEGTLSPLFVNNQEPFTFRIAASYPWNVTIASVHVEFTSIDLLASEFRNLTMDFESQYENNETNTYMYNYTLTLTTSKPVNQYIFTLPVNGTWQIVGDRDELQNVFLITGPVYKDSYAVARPVILSAIELDLFYVFAPYAIMLGMIWWTRRARRMREKQIEKWQAEQAKEDAGKPKTVSKVQSLDAAMGKVEEGFVCSECGADVPADATVCPKCGEKFD